MVSRTETTAGVRAANTLLLAFFGTIFIALNCFGQEMSFDALDKFRHDGEQFFEVGDYRGAQKTWEVGLELAKSARNQQWITYFLIALGKTHGEMDNYGAALDYFEEALKMGSSKEDERNRGVIYLAMSKVYAKFDRHKEALAVNQKAIDLFKGLGMNEGLVFGYFNAAEYYSEKHDFNQAIAYLSESRQIAEKSGRKDLIAESLLKLGALNRDIGDFEKAKDYCEESLRTYQSIENKKGIASAFMNLGFVYFSVGDTKNALASFEKSLDVSEGLGEKVGIASNLANIGMVYKSLCDYGKATLYFENSMRYSDETGSRKRVTESYLNLGNIYKSIGYCDKALVYFTEALKNLREMGDKNGLANALANLGISCGERGEYDNAVAFYQEAIETKKRIGLPYQDIIAQMVDLYLDKGKIELAQKQARQIKDQLRTGKIELYNKNYTTSAACFEDAINANTKNRNSELLFPSYCGLGESYLGLWEYEKAKEMFGEARKISESQKESLSAEEKHDFYSSKIMGFRRSTPYEGVIRMLMSTNDQKAAFTASEQLKLDIFSQAIDDTFQAASGKLSGEDAKSEEGYLQKIRNIRKEMDTFFKNNKKDEYWAKDRELKTVQAGHDEFVEGLRRTSPDYAFVKYPRPVKPHEVAIRPNELLIEFEVTDEVSYLFMVRGNDRRFLTKTIPKTRAEINEMVNRYRDFMNRDAATGQLAVFDGKVSNDIYRTLFGEILRDVPKGATLVIVPDEALGALPFGSLVMSQPENEKIGGAKFDSPSEAEYLADKYLLVYAQSATAMNFVRARRQDNPYENTGLIVSVPETEQNDNAAQGGGQSPAAGPSAMVETVDWWLNSGGKGMPLKNLAVPDELIREMESVYPGKITILSGQEAREEKIAKLPLSKYRFIAFENQSILDSGVPWLKQPAVVISRSETSGDYDGFLTLNEVIKMNIPAESVLLANCATPLGQRVTGEHAMNMGRAFQQAGTRNVVMSLWPVNGDNSVSCGSCFLARLKEGKEPAEALKNAYAELREKGYKHPYYWSSFILVSR